ncbi:MAG TPA: protein-export chaperone SecB [Bauldia sp.]|nr:protein-export chaperone SecB [Bauldia sp.]
MAANDGQTEGAGQAAPQNLGVLAQYVKDLSFENPGAPQSLRARNAPPQINVSINVSTGTPVANEVEVELKIEAEAKSDGKPLFTVELTYGGMFRLTNIPPEATRPFLMTECPGPLFPSARRVLAAATRNGGFPPLLLDPVDFVSLYRQRAAEQAPPPMFRPDQLA